MPPCRRFCLGASIPVSWHRPRRDAFAIHHCHKGGRENYSIQPRGLRVSNSYSVDPIDSPRERQGGTRMAEASCDDHLSAGNLVTQSFVNRPPCSVHLQLTKQHVEPEELLVDLAVRVTGNANTPPHWRACLHAPLCNNYYCHSMLRKAEQP